MGVERSWAAALCRRSLGVNSPSKTTALMHVRCSHCVNAFLCCLLALVANKPGPAKGPVQRGEQRSAALGRIPALRTRGWYLCVRLPSVPSAVEGSDQDSLLETPLNLGAVTCCVRREQGWDSLWQCFPSDQADAVEDRAVTVPSCSPVFHTATWSSSRRQEYPGYV